MPQEIYEVVAQGARYWFLFLMALIVWRSYRWFVRDRRQRKKRLRLLPDAGYIGEMVVQTGNEELHAGLALPISNEGTLGSLRSNDICVPVQGVAKKHLWYEYDDEEGLRVQPYGKHKIEVDGETPAGRQKYAYMTHGSRIVIGDAVLRLRMFAGFEQAGIQYSPPMQDAPETMPSAAQPPQRPEGAVAFTPQQLAAWQQMQQMQWIAAYQAMQQMNANMQPQQGYMPVNQTQESATPVLSTEHGDFAIPPKLTTQGSILAGDEADEPMAGIESPQAEQAYFAPQKPQGMRRGNALPSIDETEGYVPPDLGDGVLTADMMWAQGQAQDDSELNAGVGFDNLTFDEEPMEGAGFAPRVTFYPPVLDEKTGELRPNVADMDQDTAEWPYAAYPQSDVQFESSGYTYPEYIEPQPEDERYEYADEDEAPRSMYVETDEAAKAKRLLWDRYLKGGRRR